MQPRVKFGLIIGVIGLLINIAASAFVGVCGPVVSLIAGGIAGLLTANAEKQPTKGEGAKAGAISGLIAGLLMVIGQVIGGLVALLFLQRSGTPPLFGTIPSPSGPAGETLIYYLSGTVAALCFGLVGAALAAGVGAALGYFVTPAAPQVPPSYPQSPGGPM